MSGLSTGLLVLGLIFAVIDGAWQDKGTYPSSPGRTGFGPFARAHPWLIAATVCGIVGTVLAAISDQQPRRWATIGPREPAPAKPWTAEAPRLAGLPCDAHGRNRTCDLRFRRPLCAPC